MLNYSFYPFKKKLEEIDGDDLMLLKEVSEGWYVDYKVQCIKIPDLAKHLSAFANQYGGWLIIGVSEDKNGLRTAAGFPGVDVDDVEKISREIREASSAHSNPVILYEEKIIKGPVAEVGLEEGKAIVIIGIPMSMNSPHIHSSGRIYRRVADQSKPKEEKDRHILDDLWKRGVERKKKVARLLTDVPRLPEQQKNSPFAHIYFKPRYGQMPPAKMLEFSEFAKIVTNAEKDVVGVHAPMTAISTAPNGFVARQIEGNDPSRAALSIRWWNNGVVRFDIPLNSYDLHRFLNTHNENKYALEYRRLAVEAGYKELTIVDYSVFIQIVASLTNYYLRFLKITGDNRDVYSCFTLRNVFYTAPYIDSEGFLNRVKEHSIPLVFEENIVIPEEPSEDSMMLHRSETRDGDYDDGNEYQMLVYKFAVGIFYNVLQSVGAVGDAASFTADIEAWGFDKIGGSRQKTESESNCF